jgi:uncharacterized repeat protein (TIGR03803 family)
MKNRLKVPGLIAFALAVGLRLGAGILFVDLDDLGGPGSLSKLTGAVAQDAQGNIYATGADGDPAVNGFGGFCKFSGLGPPGEFNGNGVITYTNAFNIPGGDFGAYPSTGPVLIGGNQLVGTTTYGAANDAGAFFIVGTDGSNPMAALSLDPNYGTYATGITAGPDGNFYLPFQFDGAGFGSVGVISNSGTGTYSWGGNLRTFQGFDGQQPSGNLAMGVTPADSVQLPGVKPDGAKANDGTPTFTFYGVTFAGGTNGNGPGTGGDGTVYKVNNDSSGFQTLHVFSSQNAANGYDPAGGLALSGNTLYGTTSGGGKYGSGTVFQINTDGNGFGVIKSFSAYGFDSAGNVTNSDGEAPEGDLILSGGTLYGTTLGGGTNGGGVVFSMNTNGSNFTVLHSFSTLATNASGVYTNYGGNATGAGLLLSGHTLFGTTPYGGAYGGGTVFAIVLPVPPALDIATFDGNFSVSWPSSATNYLLQQNSTLNSLTWSNFSGAVNDDGTNKSAGILPAAGTGFFRLLSTNGL